MSELRQQIEALKTVGEYCERLIKGIQNVVSELEENRQPDTDEYLKAVIQGVNWVFQVYNATKEVIEHEGAVIDKASVNTAVEMLNQAELNNDDAKRAEALKGGILTFVKEIKTAADKIVLN